MGCYNPMQFNQEDIQNLDRFYRVNLMTSVSGYKSANLIGTRSTTGQENVAIFSSVVHMGSNPPYLGFILRPDTVPRHTYQNILDTSVYTINQVHINMLDEAHQTSAKYEEDISEFEATNLQPEYLDGFAAPFVAQSRVKMAMKLVNTLPIAVNNTILVIGQIERIYVEDDLMAEDGHVDLERAETAAVNGLGVYFSGQKIKQLPYARPKHS